MFVVGSGVGFCVRQVQVSQDWCLGQVRRGENQQYGSAASSGRKIPCHAKSEEKFPYAYVDTVSVRYETRSRGHLMLTPNCLYRDEECRKALSQNWFPCFRKMQQFVDHTETDADQAKSQHGRANHMKIHEDAYVHHIYDLTTGVQRAKDK